MNTREWQAVKKAQGGKFTEAQRIELFGSRPVAAVTREDMLLQRLRDGLPLSVSDRREAKRLQRGI